MVSLILNDVTYVRFTFTDFEVEAAQGVTTSRNMIKHV